MASRTRSKTSKRTGRTARAAGADSFAKTRERLDKKRAKRREKMLWAHYWLLCPKCGGDMFIQETLNIRYEVCRDCNGIAIDGDEVALLLTHLDPGKALRAILKKSKKPETKEI
jgi:Zn-finger nucleic acid-binding protein